MALGARRTWRAALAANVWVLVALPLALSALVRDLWAPDEPRYAEVAKEAFESGELVVLRLCGALYPDKPPLLFWLAGFVGSLGGWSAFALRLVPLAATLCTAALVALLARRWWGAREAAFAPALFLTCALVAWMGGRLQIDPLLVLLCTAALVALERDGGAGIVAAGLATGLAALSKGPVAFVVVLVPLFARRLALPEERRARARLAVALAVVLALAPLCVWAGVVLAREPSLARDFLYGQHVERALFGTRHAGAPWKHVVRLPLQLLPWTGLVLAGLAASLAALARRRAGRARDSGDRALVLAGTWLVALLVFFSLLTAKRDVYLLPAYPAAALLAARFLVVSADERRRPGPVHALAPLLLVVVGLVLALAGPLGVLAAQGIALDSRLALVASAPFVLMGLFALRALARRDPLACVRRVLVGWTLGGALAALVFLPAIDGVRSARPLASFLAARPQRPSAIPCSGVEPEAYRFYGAVPTVKGQLDANPAVLAQALARDGADFLALVRADHFARVDAAERACYRVLLRTREGSRDVLVLGAAEGRRVGAPGQRGL